MWYICNIVTLPGQCGSAQKFATLAGGYYPPLHGVSFKISFFTEMRFAFSADNGSTKLKRIYKVLKDTLYYAACATESHMQNLPFSLTVAYFIASSARAFWVLYS